MVVHLRRRSSVILDYFSQKSRESVRADMQREIKSLTSKISAQQSDIKRLSDALDALTARINGAPP